jgi:hypothetical protein
MRILPMARSALDQVNPIGGLLDLATVASRQRLYLTTGDGSGLFGEHQHIAVDAAAECSAEIEQLAAEVLTPGQLNEARSRIHEVAEANPLRGEFAGARVRVAREGGKDSVFQGLLAIPLAPFRWLGGVDETAQAVKGFTVVAARMSDVIDGFAADARVQTELLLLELEDLQAVQSGVASFEKLAASSDRMATAAETLPKQLREELTRLADDFDSRQDAWRESIRDTQVLAERVDDAAASLGIAARAIEDMVASFRPPAEEKQPRRGAAASGPAGEGDHRAADAGTADGNHGGRPFDILDYARAAEAVGQSAGELTVLSKELQALAKSSALDKRLDELDARLERLIDRAETAASGSTDHLAFRLAQVGVLLVVLIAVWRGASLLLRRDLSRPRA